MTKDSKSQFSCGPWFTEAMSEEAEVLRTAGLRMTDEEKMMKQTEEKRRRLWEEGIKVMCRLCIQPESCQNPQCSNTGEEAVWT